MEEDAQHWKQFQGTELGSLLGSIYGNKPSISYPKPKVKKGSIALNPHGNFVSGANADAIDPRKSTRRNVEVKLPSFNKKAGSTNSMPAAVDIIPKRRNEAVIRAELDDIKMKQNHYRPAYRQAISSEDEKQRLSEICTFKGGKGLPVVLPVSDAPFEIAAKLKQAQMQEAHRIRRGGPARTTGRQAAAMSAEEQLAEQITSEINERTSYLEDMKKSGNISSQQEHTIKSEIAIRLNELKRLSV